MTVGFEEGKWRRIVMCLSVLFGCVSLCVNAVGVFWIVFFINVFDFLLLFC